MATANTFGTPNNTVGNLNGLFQVSVFIEFFEQSKYLILAIISK